VVADVFVSYSRRDSEFVRQLVSDLEARGKSVWLDTDGIEDAELFPEAIRTAIEGSDAFMFVITPESAASRFCAQEVEHALELNKRLVPVLRRPVADEALPEAVRVRNWIPYTVDVDAQAASDRIVVALDTDLAHVRAHTRWLVKALEWDGSDRDKSFLLRGSELAGAETWLARVGDRAEPAPTVLQREYVVASRTASTRRQRLLVGASLIAVLVAAGLAAFALVSRSQAVNARDEAVAARADAQSRALAAESLNQLVVDPERAILLATAAVRMEPTHDAVYALQRAIDLSPIRGRLPTVDGNTFAVPSGWGPGVAYSPDGKQIAEGDERGHVTLLDARTLRVERKLTVGGFSPEVAYSPDGSLLAVSSDKGTELVDPATGAARGNVATMTNAGFLAFSPDGELLAATQYDRDFKHAHVDVWDRSAHRLRILSAGLNGYASQLGFSPDGRRLVACGNAGVGVFDLRTGKLITSALSGHPVFGCEYSPGGSTIAVAVNQPLSGAAGFSGVELLDARMLAPVARVVHKPQSYVFQARFSPDGRSLAYVGPGFFGVYSVEAHTLLYDSPEGDHSLSQIAFSPDGRDIAVTAEDGTAAVYRATGVQQATIDPGMNAGADSGLALTRDRVVMAFSPLHGRNARGKVVQTWSLDGRHASQRLDLGSSVCPVASVSPDGRLAFYAPIDCGQGFDLTKPRSIPIWNVAQRRRVTSLRTTGAPLGSAVRFSGDGKDAISQVFTHWKPSGGPDDHLLWFDVATGRRVDLGGTPCGYFLGPAINGDGSVVAGLEPCVGRLVVWRIGAGRPAARTVRLTKDWNQPNGAILSPDGTMLAVDSTGSDLAIISVRTGRVLTTLVGNTAPVTSWTFSADGALLVTGSKDGTARVWNPRTGVLLRTFDHPDGVVSVALSPGGGTLATLDQVGIVRVWQTCDRCEDPEALLALAKTRVTRTLSPAERRIFGVGT
jgi:WD40 repeat protein